MQTIFLARRVRAQRIARDAHVGHHEGEPVLRRQGERAIERGVLVVGDEEQPREPTVNLLRGEAVRVRVEPVESRTVSHFEVQRLACAGFERVEARAVLRFGKRQAVKVNGRRLRQPVFDSPVESIAAPRDDDRMRDPSRSQIGDIAAAAEHRVAMLDREALDRVERHDASTGHGRRHSGSLHGPASERNAGCRGARREKLSPVQGALPFGAEVSCMINPRDGSDIGAAQSIGTRPAPGNTSCAL